MAIDLEYDRKRALKAIERSKAFHKEVAKKRPVYSVHIGNTVVCTTSKELLKRYVELLTPKAKTVKEIEYIPLERVNELRKQKTLGEIIRELGLSCTTNHLRVMLINAGYIKTNSQISEAKEKRDKKIRSLYEQGYTFTMIKEKLGLDIKISTIERICRKWD